MTRSSLKQLIRIITEHVIDELTVPGAMGGIDNSAISGEDTPPDSSMSSAERARMERDAERARRRTLKQAESELNAKKKEVDFNKKKLDQQKRFDVPNLTKQIQRLKGAKI